VARFLSHPQGFALLNEMAWVQPQMTLWKARFLSPVTPPHETDTRTGERQRQVHAGHRVDPVQCDGRRAAGAYHSQPVAAAAGRAQDRGPVCICFSLSLSLSLSRELTGRHSTRPWSVQMPLHFYGELVKTELGCALLRERVCWRRVLSVVVLTISRAMWRRFCAWCRPRWLAARRTDSTSVLRCGLWFALSLRLLVIESSLAHRV
jgi:hypothetical protein